MTISASVLSSAIDRARATVPAARYRIRYGESGDHEVDAFQPDATRNESENLLDGTAKGVRRMLMIKLADCDPWTPPGDGDRVTLLTYAGEKIDDYFVLPHSDDPTGTFRRLTLGEESA